MTTAKAKAKKKFHVVIRQEACKGCTLCIVYCPSQILISSPSLNEQGYHYAEPKQQEECTGCMSCVLVCPDLAVEVYRE